MQLTAHYSQNTREHSIDIDPLDIDSITNDVKPIQQCDQCKEEFKYKCLRSAHVKKLHKGSSFPKYSDGAATQFACCKQTYKTWNKKFW